MPHNSIGIFEKNKGFTQYVTLENDAIFFPDNTTEYFWVLQGRFYKYKLFRIIIIIKKN